MEKNSRILVFTPAFRPLIGGSEIALEEIIRHLPNFYFDIITPRHSRSFPISERGPNRTIYRVGLGYKFDRFLFPLLGSFWAIKHINHNNVLLAHSYQASWASLAAIIVCYFKKLPLIITLQEGKNLSSQTRLLNFIRRLIIIRADHITAISTYLGQYARSINRNIPVDIIPNGVDTSFFQDINKNKSFDKSSLRAELKLPIESNIIISVSRLVPKNGLSDLIKALSILRSMGKYGRWSVVFIGSGPLKSQLSEQAIKLGLQNEVSFIGDIKRENLPEYLWASDIFVRPSYSEGLGSAFLEAMAAELPVIGTNVGGITDIIRNKETGLLVQVGQPEELVEAISLIMADSSLRKYLISSAREMVASKYTWNLIADRFALIYQSFQNRYGQKK